MSTDKAKSKPTGGLARWYAAESARPLTSLLFVLPILAIYELGLAQLGPDAMRNGAEKWLRYYLVQLGFGQHLLLPLLVCGTLLGWHHVQRQSWTISPLVLAGMAVEAVLLGLVLLMMAHEQNWLFQRFAPPLCCALDARHLVAYCGAGVYEELLFRLLLIPAAAGVAHFAGISPKGSFAAAVVVTSLVFSLAHFQLVNAGGDAWSLFAFVFRFLAGVFFSLIFLYRGFGVAAGAHTVYDVLARVIG